MFSYGDLSPFVKTRQIEGKNMKLNDVFSPYLCRSSRGGATLVTVTLVWFRVTFRHLTPHAESCCRSFLPLAGRKLVGTTNRCQRHNTYYVFRHTSVVVLCGEEKGRHAKTCYFFIWRYLHCDFSSLFSPRKHVHSTWHKLATIVTSLVHLFISEGREFIKVSENN